MTLNLHYKSLVKILKDNSLIIILVSFFIFEFITKVLDYQGHEYYRVGIFLKVLFVVAILAFRVISKSLFWQLTLLCVLFFISQLFLNRHWSLYEGVSKNVLYVAKYFFIFLVADYFRYLKLSNDDIRRIIKVVFFILWLNFAAILIGLFFNVGLFSTYGPNRFGYHGLMHINSHASYVYIFALIYVIYNFIKTKKHSANLWMVIISALLIGTKTSYLFCGLVSIYLWFYFKLYKSLVFYAVALLVLISGYMFQDKLIALFTTHYSAFVVLYNDGGIITALTSTRDVLLGDTLRLAFQKYWIWINYVIGGSFFNVLRTEMAFIDLYLFWGLGMVFYLKLYHQYISKYYMKHSFLKYAILSVFIAAFLGGNFFTNAVIAIYVVIFTNGLVLDTKK